MNKPDVSIIGTGALGSVMARALADHGYAMKGLYNRSESNLAALLNEIGVEHSGSFPETASELGKITFLTVPDDEIHAVSNQLAEHSDDFSDHIVLHCSGSKPAAACRALQQKGASIASFHPLQTFNGSSQTEDLSGIYFDAEGDEEALKFLETLVQEFGSELMVITPEAKPYLHAAAVMASNYLYTLFETASSVAATGDLSKKNALQALLPLVQQTLNNAAEAGSLPEALSGPIARGDHSTVKEHLDLLEQHPGALTLYKQLGLQTVKMASSAGKIDQKQEQKLVTLLES